MVCALGIKLCRTVSGPKRGTEKSDPGWILHASCRLWACPFHLHNNSTVKAGPSSTPSRTKCRPSLRTRLHLGKTALPGHPSQCEPSPGGARPLPQPPGCLPGSPQSSTCRPAPQAPQGLRNLLRGVKNPQRSVLTVILPLERERLSGFDSPGWKPREAPGLSAPSAPSLVPLLSFMTRRESPPGLGSWKKPRGQVNKAACGLGPAACCPLPLLLTLAPKALCSVVPEAAPRDGGGPWSGHCNGRWGRQGPAAHPTLPSRPQPSAHVPQAGMLPLHP